MKVHEYRPAFFEGFPTREAEIEKPTDALEGPWLKEKGKLTLDGRYVMHGKWVVGLIVEET